MVEASGGASGAPPLRRLNAPRQVGVRTDAASTPAAVRRNGRWLEVIELLDRYRTDDRWWTERPIVRTYYELLLEDGQAATVFRDDARGGWWEQRYG